MWSSTESEAYYTVVEPAHTAVTYSTDKAGKCFSSCTYVTTVENLMQQLYSICESEPPILNNNCWLINSAGSQMLGKRCVLVSILRHTVPVGITVRCLCVMQ